jgi:hypothetical protein
MLLDKNSLAQTCANILDLSPSPFLGAVLNTFAENLGLSPQMLGRPHSAGVQGLHPIGAGIEIDADLHATDES